jgi:dihydroorotate dehydrogenase
VLVHVAAAGPAEVAECLSLLETVGGVAGIELGLRDGTPPGEAEALTAAAARAGGLPVIVRLPFPAAPEAALAAHRAGAVALTVCAPPRGALPGPNGRPVAGRLFSPALFPLTLHAVNAITRATGLPVIASGGIFDAQAARALLAVGAVAVQVDALAWRDPGGLAELAEALGA